MNFIDNFNFKDYYQHQIEWYTKQAEWSTREIEWLNKEIERERKEDRELQDYIWNRGVLTAFEKEIYGNKNYEGSETRKLKAQRKREYKRRKKYLAEVEDYKVKLANCK